MKEEKLAFVLITGKCVELEHDSLIATKLIYQLIKGAQCTEHGEENLIAFY